MTKPVKSGIYVAALWLITLFVLACLTSCTTAGPDTIYTPTDVEVPVGVDCKSPVIPKPPDLLKALPKTATLTQGMKSGLAQHSYDLGYEKQLEASIAACQ